MPKSKKPHQKSQCDAINEDDALRGNKAKKKYKAVTVKQVRAALKDLESLGFVEEDESGKWHITKLGRQYGGLIAHRDDHTT